MPFELTVGRDAILPALEHAARVAAGRTSMPVLRNVLITIFPPNKVTLRATDLEVDLSLTVDVDAKIGQLESVVVEAKRLAEIVKAMPDVPVRLAVEGTQLLVEAGKGKIKLPTIKTEDFPEPMEIKEPSVTLNITKESVIAALDCTSFAVSASVNRFNIAGCLFEVTQKGLQLVATDGHRLSVMATPTKRANGSSALLEGPAAPIVPRTGLSHLTAFCKRHDDIKVELHKNWVRAVANGEVLVTRAIDGSYPDYSVVIPAGNQAHGLQFCRQDLSEALERVKLVTDSDRLVWLSVEDGALSLSCTTSHGECDESIDAEITGGNYSLCINSAYLAEALAKMQSENARLEWSPAKSLPNGKRQYFPTKLTGEGDEGFLHVIMPGHDSEKKPDNPS